LLQIFVAAVSTLNTDKYAYSDIVSYKETPSCISFSIPRG